MAVETKVSGVYCLQESGESSLVHTYTDEDYELFDIVELFSIGELEPEAVAEGAVFTRQRGDARKLKFQADAESFDHPEGFIEMCVDIYRYADTSAEQSLRFISVE